MSKDKLKRLVKYYQDLKNRLESPTPSKHKGHPETYKAFLLNEIRMVSLQIEAAKGL